MKTSGFKMRGNRFLIILIAFLCFSGLSQGIAIDVQNTNIFQQSTQNQGIINITPQEAWEMCSTTSDGLQFPIDVRSRSEWVAERIDTPFPEFTNTFALSALQTESGLQTFREKYDGENVIIYCLAGSRSAAAAQILASNNFNGTIYNMEGGITAWKQANLPTKKGNTPPSQPSPPIGPDICGVGQNINFQATGIDPDDDVIRYGWDINDDGSIDIWSEFVESGDLIELSYIYSSPGIFNITVLIEDIVGERSAISDKKTVLVTTPPANPTINGPNKGKVNEDLIFLISSSDMDGDNVYYLVDWGDDTGSEWIGPYEQGTSIEITHLWDEEKTYTLRVKAKDIHDVESDWTYHHISLPKMNMLHHLNRNIWNLFNSIFRVYTLSMFCL
jgi:rhodanese-related sulfurtransferase